MLSRFFRQAICIALLAAGCTSCITNEPWVRIGGEKFAVEIADTPDKQQLGLMFRDSMPRNRGMLFIFPGESARSFWMKNTRISLDILYFDKDLQLVTAIRGARPCRTTQCPSYPSKAPAMYVLELNAGLADELELELGDRLEVKL